MALAYMHQQSRRLPPAAPIPLPTRSCAIRSHQTTISDFGKARIHQDRRGYQCCGWYPWSSAQFSFFGATLEEYASCSAPHRAEYTPQTLQSDRASGAISPSDGITRKNALPWRKTNCGRFYAEPGSS